MNNNFPNKRQGQNRPKPRNTQQNSSNITNQEGDKFVEKLISVNRCSTVVKGGRRFSFSALVVRGNGKGQIGLGYGKANEAPDAIRKATEQAQKHTITIDLHNTTIPHPVVGKSDGARVILRPASAGTGKVAGGAIREVLTVIGVSDILSKSLGSSNPLSLVNATLNALKSLRSKSKIRAIRSATV